MRTIVQEYLILDFIKGEFHGGQKDLDSDRDGIYPVVQPLATGKVDALLPAIKSKQKVNYALDKNKHILNVDDPEYGPPLKILRPSKDMPGVNYERTIWAQLFGAIDDERQELLEENKRLRKQVGELKKEIDRLEESQADQERRDSQPAAPQLPCPMCGNKATMETWKRNEGKCSQCGSVNKQFKDGDES